MLQFPRRFTEQKKCQDCIAHELFESKNTKYAFGSFKCEDSKFVYHTDDAKNSYDVCGGEIQWGLEVETSDNSYMSKLTMWCWKSKEMYYSDNCHSCSDCFGCVGLKHKQYCILNKQYTKEEYEELVPKIIEHMSTERRSADGGKLPIEWGEFFPASLSPFAYNETVAQEYFSLTKEEAIKRGYKWKEEDTKEYKKQTYKIPDDIKDVPDSICKEILACERTGKNYKIQKAELKFYKKMNLPIPRLHPDERHKDRMKLRNPRKLWSRQCDTCKCNLQTTFAPERPEKILCEDCYLKIVD